MVKILRRVSVSLVSLFLHRRMTGEFQIAGKFIEEGGLAT